MSNLFNVFLMAFWCCCCVHVQSNSFGLWFVAYVLHSSSVVLDAMCFL